MIIYLASPLGFAESTRHFMIEIERSLSDRSVEVVNPWRNPIVSEIGEAQRISDRHERIQSLRSLNNRIGASNENALRRCDMVVAVLDGVDVDSGTASEIGFAYAVGKLIIGVRTDFRLSSDNEAASVNLQVQYWIETCGGKIVGSLAELDELIAELQGSQVR